MKAVVAGSWEQAQRLRPEGGAALVLCANGAAAEACRSRGGDVVVLDEALLEGRLDELNRWAHEALLRWLAQQTAERARFCFESSFYELRAYFVRTARYLAVFERLFAGGRVSEVHAEDDGESALAPVLESAFPDRVRIRPAPPKPPTRPRPLRRGLLGLAAAAVSFQSRATLESWKRRGAPILAASGALRHLDPVLTRLPKTAKVVFVETAFERDKAAYCRRRGHAYCVLPDRADFDRPPATEIVFLRPGDAVLDGRDVSAVLNAVLERVAGRAYMFRPFDRRALGRFLAASGFRSVLLDEDSALRRAVFLEAQARGIPCFSVSHGIPTRRIFGNAPPPELVHRTSVTFVHSSFEKEAYRSHACDAAKIRVSGLPRYDRIPSIERRMADGREGRILYCTGTMVEYDFLRRSAVTDVLGSAPFCREASIRHLQGLLRALEQDLRLRLSIKPHYADEDDWKRVLNKLGADPARVSLLTHRDDTLALEARADVVVTPESSVICESLMLGRPVIVVDYPSPKAGSPYDAGIVQRAHSDEELRAALERALWDEAYRRDWRRCLDETGSRFTGELDGQAGARVARALMGEASS